MGKWKLLIFTFNAVFSVLNVSAQPPGPSPIIRKPLLTALIEGAKVVERIEVKQSDFSPNQRTGLHFHPCPVVGLVTGGSIVFQIEGQPMQHLKSGDAFYEPANTKVLHFDAQENGARFVAYYLLSAGEHELIKMLE